MLTDHEARGGSTKHPDLCLFNQSIAYSYSSYVLYLFLEQQGYTALYLACQYGHIQVVKVLLQYGAQVNKPCKV